MYYNLEFEHYGVKGMKWGRRKASKNTKAGNTYKKGQNAGVDKHIYGEKGVSRIAKRIDKGSSLKNARRIEDIRKMGRARITPMLVAGGILASTKISEITGSVRTGRYVNGVINNIIRGG